MDYVLGLIRGAAERVRQRAEELTSDGDWRACGRELAPIRRSPSRGQTRAYNVRTEINWTCPADSLQSAGYSVVQVWEHEDPREKAAMIMTHIGAGAGPRGSDPPGSGARGTASSHPSAVRTS
jgi:hypothetical protein